MQRHRPPGARDHRDHDRGPGSASHRTGPSARPKMFAMPVASPNCDWKMNFQYRPVTTGATAHGSRIAMPSSVAPRKRRLSSSAVASASGTVSSVAPSGEDDRARDRLEEVGSDGEPLVVPEPGEEDVVVLEQLDPQEADAEHREDRRHQRRARRAGRPAGTRGARTGGRSAGRGGPPSGREAIRATRRALSPEGPTPCRLSTIYAAARADYTNGPAAVSTRFGPGPYPSPSISFRWSRPG